MDLAGIYAIAITIRFLYAEFVYLPFNSAEFYTEMAFQCVFVPHHICSPRSFFIADRSVDPHKKEMPAKAGGENAVDHTSVFALPFRIWTSVCAILGVFDFMFSDLKERASYEAKGWLICQNF